MALQEHHLLAGAGVAVHRLELRLDRVVKRSCRWRRRNPKSFLVRCRILPGAEFLEVTLTAGNKLVFSTPTSGLMPTTPRAAAAMRHAHPPRSATA